MRKFDAYLPYVPSQEEAFQFISAMPDIKPRAMCALMCSSDLRIGEVCRLRYEDFDRKNMRIHISHAKARQDRYASLSRYALNLLTIKALLGHKSLESAMIYVHLAATRFSDVINSLDKMGGIYGTK